MKKVVVISKGLETNKSLCQQFKSLIGDVLEVSGYCLEDDISLECNNCYVVFTSIGVKDVFTSKYKLDFEYIIARRVIDYSKLSKLISLPAGSEVLLINNTEQSCYEAIEQLKKLSIDHIKYYPYYPGIKEYKKLELAVTPGESGLAPSYMNKIIDIGNRQIDITTLVEILIRFNMLDESGSLISSEFVREIVDLSKRYSKMADKYLKMKDKFEVIVDNTSEGIIYLNTKETISIVNEVFISMLGTKKEKIINHKLADVLPELNSLKIEQSNVLLKINGKSLSANKVPIKREEKIVGYMITIKDVTEIQELEHNLRRKMNEKKYITKYNFSDIVTESNSVKKTIELAKKLALSKSAILIQGESGTGKELLAQSIHNSSGRRKRQFVPVNFAALSSSLLESQIFGYEEGSFTGAKKGGNPGFFEEAHGGTIFLDEIGDTPIEFQATLLRVLQERQVRRVGGTKLIPIDVKIIAATNRDLKKMVEKGEFRQDLYYRLNVLPLYIPPLRERKKDIKLLLDVYLKRFSKNDDINCTNFFTKDAMEYLVSYNWLGNVRELVNIVEYVVNIKNEIILIDINDLPLYMINDDDKKDRISKYSYNDEILWLLNKINDSNGIGRRRLALLSKEEELSLTEAKIKRLMKIMVEEELIKKNIGVKGTTITEKGSNFLKDL